MYKLYSWLGSGPKRKGKIKVNFNAHKNAQAKYVSKGGEATASGIFEDTSPKDSKDWSRITA